MPFEEPLAFKVEWFDAASSLHRHFNFSFYQSDTSVEMFDTKLRKMFLKRCAISGLDRKELFVGNTIVVFSRHLLIKDYANEYTKDQVENDKQSTLILLYPDAHDQLGFVLDCLERGGYNLCRARSLKFTLVMFNFKFISLQFCQLDGVLMNFYLPEKNHEKIRETVFTFKLGSAELPSI